METADTPMTTTWGARVRFTAARVRRVQDMPLKRWNRMGGNGTFIQLYGPRANGAAT